MIIYILTCIILADTNDRTTMIVQVAIPPVIVLTMAIGLLVIVTIGIFLFLRNRSQSMFFESYD